MADTIRVKLPQRYLIPWFDEADIAPRPIAPAPAPAPAAVAVMERPTAVPFTLPPVLPNDEYLQVADRIGLVSPPVLKAKLERFLAVNGWPLYPYDKVWKYLEQLAEKENPPRAARPSFEAGLGPVNSFADQLRRMEWDMVNLWGPPSVVRPVWKPLRAVDADGEKVYDKAVPMHALLKVEALEQEIGPNKLTFHVSDYKAVNPDPFLMVTAPGLDKYVIDVWDEPGFTA